MKIRNVTYNNRKHEFSVMLYSGAEYQYPYSETDTQPTTVDSIKEVYVDRELGNEAFTYILESGKEGTVHIEQILEYHEDPKYMAELLTYKLSVEAQHRIEKSSLSRRQIAKRLNTSVPQLYRLLDPANTSKSMSQLITLLHILNCNVDFVVKQKSIA